MKDIIILYSKNKKICEIASKVLDSLGYTERLLVEGLSVFHDKEFVVSTNPEIIKVYRRIKDDEENDISFIGFDDSSLPYSEQIYNARNHLTHYFDGLFFSAKDVEDVLTLIVKAKREHKEMIMLESFGFKLGNPIDVDLVIDARVLPNAFWVDELRNKCGLDKEVRDYVLNGKSAMEYVHHVESFLSYYFENMEKRSKRMPLVGIACTGGQHRSITLVEYLKDYFSPKYIVYIKHREINRFLCRK